ncbi:uncharacterized protein N7483_009242 [Penicillium malachiteum]|uniref:uncharacterized protein n=1 Tax=Penicillium malachiteum TaxID=1324776 RepID=UPI0025466D62|nr:uncharacterized protein N7483_009242 [Penicillium malachiteum]KAJ5721308.1 hypothetical protein N7483_009242 [Penicillium malachiteum]
MKERNSYLENSLSRILQISDCLQLVAKADLSVPRSQLSEAVKLVQRELNQEIRCAQDYDSLYEDDKESDVEERVKRVLSSLPASPPTEPSQPAQTSTIYSAPLVLTQAPWSSSSNFWSSFFQTSHPIIPSVDSAPAHDDPRPTNLNQVTEFSTRSIPYATTHFTQRLYRVCAQSGYRFLVNSNVSDQSMWPEFGLMLQKLPRSEVTSYFQRILMTEPCNPVEDSRFPFIIYGGAGTNFLAHKRDASSQYPGLEPFEKTNGIIEVDSDEKWFDVLDVERYLIHQGFQLSNPQKDFSGQHEHYPFAPSDPLNSGLSMGIGQTNLQPPLKKIDEDFIIEGCAAAFRRHDVEKLILRYTW